MNSCHDPEEYLRRHHVEAPATFDPAPGSDASNRIPAEVFPVRDFIKEEMEARAWTMDDLIDHMPGDQNVNRLTLDLIFAIPEFDEDIRKASRIGEKTASDLAHAFGTSKELWLNLEAVWVKQQNTKLSDGPANNPKP